MWRERERERERVREVMVSDPNFSRKSLSKRAKLVVEEES